MHKFLIKLYKFITFNYQYLVFCVLVAILVFLLRKLFAKLSDKILTKLDLVLFSKKISFSSVVFLFFCIFCGCFSGCCLSFFSFNFTFHFFFMIVFTSYNFWYVFTLVFFQFLTCAFFLSFSMKNFIPIIFSVLDIFEVLAIYFLQK